MTKSTIETARGKIEFSISGRGKAILFIHGGHSNCNETILHKGLSQESYCFITPSRPGYGNTPLTSSNKTPKGTADLFIALLDELKLTKVIVIGISAGGLTALEIAANYSERVENLVLMSALSKKWFKQTDKIYKKGKKLFAPKIESFTWSLYKLFFNLFPSLMTKVMFEELSKCKSYTFTKEESLELKQMTSIMRSGSGFVNDLDQTIEQDILAMIKCPTLILHSEYDNAVDISHPQNANVRIKTSKLVTFKNHWGHLLWIGNDYKTILDELKKHL